MKRYTLGAYRRQWRCVFHSSGAIKLIKVKCVNWSLKLHFWLWLSVKVHLTQAIWWLYSVFFNVPNEQTFPLMIQVVIYFNSLLYLVLLGFGFQVRVRCTPQISKWDGILIYDVVHSLTRLMNKIWLNQCLCHRFFHRKNIRMLFEIFFIVLLCNKMSIHSKKHAIWFIFMWHNIKSPPID